MKTKTIRHAGRQWRLHREQPDQLTFVPDTIAINAIKAWREREKLNQREAAPRLGISQTQLAKIELGKRSCPQKILDKIKF